MDTNKFRNLITKLHRLTLQKDISWKQIRPPSNIIKGTDYIIPLCFSTNYDGQNIAIYEQRHREYDGFNDVDYWTSDLVFSILDIDDNEIWSISLDMPVLSDLYESVKYQVADVDRIINKLIKAD